MTLARIDKARRELDGGRAKVIALEQLLQGEVRKFLLARNMSLRETAKAMGFTVAYLSDVINGRRKVSVAVIEAIRRLK
jgi:hypothetical protein